MILQGSNKPIVIELDMDVSEAKDISICLRGSCGNKNHAMIQRWGLDDVQIIGNTITIPVTQRETLRYPEGEASILVKCTIDGKTEFFDEFPINIMRWCDNTILME